MIRMCNECLHVGEHHPNCPNAEDAPPETPAMTETEATYVVCDTLNIMFRTQQRLANDVGVNAALDMFESLGEHDVDQTDAGVTGAMSGVLYTVLRFVLDFSSDAEKARQYVNAALDVAIENYEKGEL